MNQPTAAAARPSRVAPPDGADAPILDLARCLSCRGRLGVDAACLECGRPHPLRGGILEAIGPLEGRNRIVAAFYDGPGWQRFRAFEQGFLMIQGGVRRARRQILQHVEKVHQTEAIGLEVGIGDGENLRYLPPQWTNFGVDLARSRLEACMVRHAAMAGRLAHAEGERLPFADATFDACWSVGGFNYFRDHEATLREMRRVTRPGGPLVVADEVPGLHRAGIGHLIGLPRIDAVWLGLLGLDRSFVEMVLGFRDDLDAIFGRVWPGAARHRIWHGLGYCWVDRA